MAIATAQFVLNWMLNLSQFRLSCTVSFERSPKTDCILFLLITTINLLLKMSIFLILDIRLNKPENHPSASKLFKSAQILILICIYLSLSRLSPYFNSHFYFIFENYHFIFQNHHFISRNTIKNRFFSLFFCIIESKYLI